LEVRQEEATAKTAPWKSLVEPRSPRLSVAVVVVRAMFWGALISTRDRMADRVVVARGRIHRARRVMGVLLLMVEHKEALAVKVRWAEVVVAAEEEVPAKEGKMAVAEPVETAETAKYQTSREPSYITPVAAAVRVIGPRTFKDGAV